MSGFKWFKPETDPLFFTLEPEMQIKIDQARTFAGVPMVVTSGRRSAEANAAAGGVATSLHVAGLACDFRVSDAGHLYRMIDGLKAAGFSQFVVGVKIVEGKLRYHNLHVEKDDAHPEPHLSVKLY